MLSFLYSPIPHTRVFKSHIKHSNGPWPCLYGHTFETVSSDGEVPVTFRWGFRQIGPWTLGFLCYGDNGFSWSAVRHLSVHNHLTIFLSSPCLSSLTFIIKKKKKKNFFKKIINLILPVLGLLCFVGFSLVAVSEGYFLVAERGSFSF